jgi:hypothetical protein
VRGCDANPRAAHTPDGTVCLSHHGLFRWEPVRGTYSNGIRCDSRCQYARGPQCDCSCAGRNHGRGWLG